MCVLETLRLRTERSLKLWEQNSGMVRTLEGELEFKWQTDRTKGEE